MGLDSVFDSVGLDSDFVRLRIVLESDVAFDSVDEDSDLVSVVEDLSSFTAPDRA